MSNKSTTSLAETSKPSAAKETREIYPLTIVKDRYNGKFSKGKWIAFMHSAKEAAYFHYDAGETTCTTWWEDAYATRYNYHVSDKTQKAIFGVGDTIHEAVQDLRNFLYD